MLRHLTAVAAAVALSAAAAGQDVTWAGPPAGGSWASAANWSSTPLLPGPSNQAVFGAAVNTAATVTLDGDQTVFGVTTVGATGPLTIAAGAGTPTAVLTLTASSSNPLLGLLAGGSDLTVQTAVAVVGSRVGLLADPGRTLTLSGQLRLASSTTTPQQVEVVHAATGAVNLAGGLRVTGDGGVFGPTVRANPSSQLGLTASQTWEVSSAGLSVIGSGAMNLGPAGQTLTVRPTAATTNVPVLFLGATLAGAGGLTLAPAASNAPGAGVVQISPDTANGPNTATGPLTVSGGTLAVFGGAWAGSSVTVSGGQLLPGRLFSPLGSSNALPPTTVLALSGTGAYNLGVPDFATGSMAAAVPLAHTQRYASVSHAGSGAFNTGGQSAQVAVTGTFTHAGSGEVVVNPGGTLTANRLDLPAGGGAVQVQGGSGLPGRLSVGDGGLTMADRTITLAGTATGGAVLELTGTGVLSASGASGIVRTGPAGSGGVVLGTARPVSVAAGGTLTVTADVSGGLVKQGAGTLVLAGANVQNFGTTRLEAGRWCWPTPPPWGR